MATQSSILAWKIPWTEPVGYSPWGHKESDMTEQLSTHTHIYVIYLLAVFDFEMLNKFPDSSVGKNSACNAGDPGSILGLGRSTGEGIGYPLQYSCLGNTMDRGGWWATVPEVAKSMTQLSLQALHLYPFICCLPPS